MPLLPRPLSLTPPRLSLPYKPLRHNRLLRPRWPIKPKPTPKLWLTSNRLHWPISPLPSKRPTRRTRPLRPLKPQLSAVVVATVDSAEDMVAAMEDVLPVNH